MARPLLTLTLFLTLQARYTEGSMEEDPLVTSTAGLTSSASLRVLLVGQATSHHPRVRPPATPTLSCCCTWMVQTAATPSSTVEDYMRALVLELNENAITFYTKRRERSTANGSIGTTKADNQPENNSTILSGRNPSKRLPEDGRNAPSAVANLQRACLREGPHM